jgi:hypothetical protein
MRSLPLLFAAMFIIAWSCQCYSQDLKQVNAQWELRNSSNDPEIASGDHNKLRLKFKTATSISFTGSKGDVTPSSLVLEMAFKPSGIYVIPLYIQVKKKDEWVRHTVDLPVNRWGEVLTKNIDVLQPIFDDFKAGTRARVRIGYNGEDWYEFSLTTFKSLCAKLFSSKKAVASSAVIRDSYGFPLMYGDKNSEYVKAIQKVLLPEHLWTGNFSDPTKNAVFKFLEDNETRINLVGINGSLPLDGSMVSVALYNRILDPRSGSNGNTSTTSTLSTSTNTSNTTNSSTTTPDPNKTQSTYTGSMVIRFPLNIGFGKGSEEEGNVVFDIQNAVGAKHSGTIDQETIDKIKTFIADPEKQKIMQDDKPDSRDKSLLNNNKITQRLYNIIIDTANEADRQAGRIVK